MPTLHDLSPTAQQPSKRETPPVIEPLEVTLSEDLRRIAEFRTEAWILDGLVTSEQLVDGVFPIEGDEHCRHWVIEEDGRIVAAGRLSVHPSLDSVFGAHTWEIVTPPIPFPCACLTRLVVHPTRRKHGLAKCLDIHRIEVAKTELMRCVIGLPQPGREKSLGELGFRQIGFEPSFYHAPYGAAPNGLPVMMLPL